MPSLAQLTDAYQQPDNIMPVEPIYTPLPKRLIMNMSQEGEPRLEDNRPEPIPPQSTLTDGGLPGTDQFMSRLSDIYNNLKAGAKSVSDFDQKFTSDVLNLPKNIVNNPELLKNAFDKLGIAQASGGSVPGKTGQPWQGNLSGEERYQLWPEKVVRSALSALPEAASGNLPTFITDPNTGETIANPEVISRTLDMASLGGAGGLTAGAEGTLGSAPFLRPALKYGDKIYKAPAGGEHLDALPAHLADEFHKQAMSGEDISNFNFGFMNHKGQFLDREKALDYAIKEGLIDQHAGKYGALTSTLLADSSKLGTAIEAMAKIGQPFYSAVEHNVNAIPQAKMTGDQWLGTLANKPGVKPEEMDWTGLKDFLKEKSKDIVTKEEVQQHLQNNKVELKEVNKGTKDWKDLTPAQQDRVANDFREHFPDQHTSRNPDWDAVQDYYKLRSTEGDYNLGSGEGGTKYHSYQLPGASNYREMLLTLPSKVDTTKLPSGYRIEPSMLNGHQRYEVFGPGEGRYSSGSTEEQAIARFHQQHPYQSNSYKSSHWDEPNVLAHIRMNDRNIEGKKSLHLEEIQSDWHQQGREKGYAPEREKLLQEVIDKEKASIVAHQLNKPNKADYLAAFNEANDRLNKFESAGRAVPNAPFKKTEAWTSLALKRMIREAAEKGYDRLSWTPGEAQAARYDLSKQVDHISYSDKGTLQAKKNDNTVLHEENVPKEKLADYIGKEAAKKLLESKSDIKGLQYLDGENLKVGGEGMKGFYDQIIPKALEKITGEKVHYNSGKIGRSLEEELKNRGLSQKSFNELSLSQRNKILEKVNAGKPVHYIELPQSLKDKALLKGFPLFSGKYMFTPVSGDPFEENK